MSGKIAADISKLGGSPTSAAHASYLAAKHHAFRIAAYRRAINIELAKRRLSRYHARRHVIAKRHRWHCLDRARWAQCRRRLTITRIPLNISRERAGLCNSPPVDDSAVLTAIAYRRALARWYDIEISALKMIVATIKIKPALLIVTGPL